jgi:hypothetical protein
VRITADRVALIDRDESHVDVPDSTSCCPTTPRASTTPRTTSPDQASAAWEAAVCRDDEYSVKRLAEVRPA